MTVLVFILVFGYVDAEQISVQFLRYAGWSPKLSANNFLCSAKCSVRQITQKPFVLI